jgi:hypothetical protein
MIPNVGSQVIYIKDTGLKEDFHAVLLKVVHKNGGYEEKPHFTHAKQPSIQQRLDSMQFAGNTVGVAKLAAKEMKDESFWKVCTLDVQGLWIVA